MDVTIIYTDESRTCPGGVHKWCSPITPAASEYRAYWGSCPDPNEEDLELHALYIDRCTPADSDDGEWSTVRHLLLTQVVSRDDYISWLAANVESVTVDGVMMFDRRDHVAADDDLDAIADEPGDMSDLLDGVF